MKAILKRYLPPAFLELIRRRFLWSGKSYSTYAEALQACGQGYDQADLAEIVLHKTQLRRDELEGKYLPAYQAELAGLSAALAYSGNNKKLNVIDFGGACGMHYFIASQLFGHGVDLQWSVVETPSMVKAAKILEDSSLSFYSNLDDAVARFTEKREAVDLAFSSGALQYTEDPMAFLRRLVAIRANCISISRIGMVTEGDGGVVIQKTYLGANGPGRPPVGFVDKAGQYPVTLLNIRSYEAALREGYALLYTTCEEANAYYIRGRGASMHSIFGRRCDLGS